MKKLQLIKDGVVVNTIVVDCDEAILNEEAAPGWLCVNGVFSRPIETPEGEQV